MKKILFLLFISNILFAQNEDSEYGGLLCGTAKLEAYKRANQNKNARIQYPGDDRIDMGYYLLKLRVSNSPQYLNGETTLFVKAKQSINEVLIDLETNMKTDSIKIGSKKVNFTAQNNQK
jgi:aminopeptidase N